MVFKASDEQIKLWKELCDADLESVKFCPSRLHIISDGKKKNKIDLFLNKPKPNEDRRLIIKHLDECPNLRQGNTKEFFFCQFNVFHIFENTKFFLKYFFCDILYR